MSSAVCILVTALMAFYTVSAGVARGAAAGGSGLSFDFYSISCPTVASVIRSHLRNVFEKDKGVAASLLRLHFHDCFVQGCDASVLLQGSVNSPSEQQAPPNRNLRASALQVVGELRQLIDQACGQLVVSCADILTMAARDSVYLSKGPDFDVPLGRRDTLKFASAEVTKANLPSPGTNATALLRFFATKNMEAVDLVALSGGHTLGLGHCPSFTARLYPTVDPTMDAALAARLMQLCPELQTNATTILDPRTPDQFDNSYFVGLVRRQGLFTSDQDLFSHPETRVIVQNFAADEELFYHHFVRAMLKMGRLAVLTGEDGEIRRNCSLANSESPVVVGGGD